MAEIDESKVETTETKPTEVVEANKPETKAEDEEKVKLKNSLSRANSEAAEWKRKYVASLDEAKKKELEAAEAAEAEAKERQAERDELNALRTFKRTSLYKEKLIDAGYDLATADLMAKALPEGVPDEYFATQKTFIENQQKAIEAKMLTKQPTLSVGLPPSGGMAKSEEDAKYDRWFGLT